MRTRDSPPVAPPVHVHVPETTPVHVHMRRSPQNRTKEAQVKGDGGRPKVRTPWIPPGRLSSRRDRSRVQLQSDSGLGPEQGEGTSAVSKNLSLLLREQESMRRSNKSDSRGEHRDTDLLLRSLVEAEIDGVAVTNQLTALKETFDSLAKDKRLSKPHAASLVRQQDLLLEKIEMFDNTNHSLRELLRDWSQYERELLDWCEQKDSIKSRLEHSEAENIRLSSRLTNKEKEASKLAEHLNFEKDNAKTTEELSRVLQATRQHLETQLGRAERDKTELAERVQSIQQSFEQQQQQLEALRQSRDREQREQEQRDREALAVCSQQAQTAEDTARQLAGRLQEKESQLSQALSTSSDWCLRHSKESAARGQLEEETSALKSQLSELTSQLQSSEEKIRSERKELMDQLHHLSAENTSTKLDNQQLQGQQTCSEQKLSDLHAEARRLKSSIKKQETLLEKYKKKLHQARLEAEDSCMQYERVSTEAREAHTQLDRQRQQLREQLSERSREMSALPHRLRKTEEKLRDSQQETQALHRRNMEHNNDLAEVRQKVEQQGSQLETLQQRNALLTEENIVLKEKINHLERRLEELSAEHQGLCQSVASREERVLSVETQLQHKSLECTELNIRLQQALDDAHRQVDSSLQKVLAKEKSAQCKALDLQSQLSRAKAEQSLLQKSKEEMERRFQTQLQNMKERLEQSDSTNRSLHNYVTFLKSSYGNVFGDSLLAS